MSSINQAREKYRPDKITCLFVAESPPADPSRFFYFEKVFDHNTLFLEIIKVFYKPTEPTIRIRLKKGSYLTRFKEDGYFLVDAMDEPIGVSGTQAKTKKVIEHQHEFIRKISKIIDKTTPITLISRPVYDGLCSFLKKEGYNVINTEMVDFPGSGRQKAFREKLHRLLAMGSL